MRKGFTRISKITVRNQPPLINFHKRLSESPFKNPFSTSFYLAHAGGLVFLRQMEDLLNFMNLHGWAAMPECMTAGNSLRLKNECQQSWLTGNFRRAGVGRGETLQTRSEIRLDEVMWLEPDTKSAEQQYISAC